MVIIKVTDVISIGGKSYNIWVLKSLKIAVYLKFIVAFLLYSTKN
jgi:hypothetical protein